MMTFQQLFSRARNNNEVQDALNEFRRNPDWRQIAAFFLGLVFLSCLRHAWYAPFIREPLASVFSTLRGQGQDAEKGQAQLFMRAEFKRQKLRSANNLFAFMVFAALGMSSITQFFSLLLFGPRSQVLCSISLGLGLGASVAARVIGLFALSIELKHRFEISRFELVVYWFLLLSALGVTGGTIFFTLGRLITVPNFGDLSICVKRHFLPTSLTASVTLIVLEMYTLFRILFGVTISHVVSDVSLRRVGALLLLDLAVVVPDAVPTNILGDFLPFSVASLVLLSAFGSRSTPQQPGHSKSASSDSSSTSSSSSPMLATPPHMARIDQAGSSPTPSQRAFHNSLMGIPALGATMRNLRGMSGGAPPQLPPLQIQMPNGSMPVTKELPNLPTEHVLGSEEFRSNAATLSSSPSQYSTSDDGAAMQRPGTTPSQTTQMPGSTPRSGKIMVSQVQFANQSERDQTSGLSPAPRAMQPARPRLFVDTARPDDLESHMTTPDAHDMVRTTPRQLGFDPARSMVSPAMMATPGRRVSARTRSSVYSPQTIESAPAHRATYTSLPGDAHKRGSKRKSYAPTFGNRRSVRHPNVPVTPEEPSPVLDIGPLVNQFPAVFPAQWMARPVRPIRVARGPRERPRQIPYPSPDLPTSAPPVQPTSASSIRQPLSAPLMWKARSDQDKDEWHSVVAA